MKTIVFDIETVGFSFESLSESQKEYLLRPILKEVDSVQREIKKDEMIRSLNLSALTAQIVTIGMYSVEKDKFFVVFQSDQKEEYTKENGRFTFKSVTETELLKNFWKIVRDATRIVTFNGKSFDIPFIHLRSAILKIKPSRNLLSNRYDNKLHCDLLDQLSFFGLTRKFNLDFYCKAFEIDSPKGGDVTGYNINETYAQKRYREIAEYCGKDLEATYQLYKYYTEYIEKFE